MVPFFSAPLDKRFDTSTPVAAPSVTGQATVAALNDSFSQTES